MVQNRQIENIEKTKKCSKKSDFGPIDQKVVSIDQKYYYVFKMADILKIGPKFDELEQFFTFGLDPLPGG